MPSLGFDVPEWIENQVWLYALVTGLSHRDAFEALARRGLDIDQMWAIDAALNEADTATKH